MISDPSAAKFALLVQYAMDSYCRDPADPLPAADPRMTGFTLVGHIVGQDSIFRACTAMTLGRNVSYGFLAQSVADPTQYVAVIRGTDGLIEWLEDGEFLSIPHPIVGRVEAGFWGVYQSMRYYHAVGAVAVPLADGIGAAIGTGTVKVIGHSLGSALATYLAFDLARTRGAQVSATLFASPHPGNAAFCAAFDALVKDYELYNFTLDLVPHVPVGPDYATLPRALVLALHDVQAKIRISPACWHHVCCYAAELDYDLLNWNALGTMDRTLTACIRGPSDGQSTGTSANARSAVTGNAS